MALVNNLTSNTTNTSLFTFSSWFKLPQLGSFWVGRADFPLGSTDLTGSYIFPGNLSLFEWGYVETTTLGGTFSWSAIQIVPYYSGSVNGPRAAENLGKTPIGVRIKLTAFSPTDPDGLTGSGFPVWAWGRGPFDSGLPFQYLYMEAEVAGFDFTTWHHLLITVNQSIGDSWIGGGPSAAIPGVHTMAQGSLASIVIDGVRYVATVGLIPVGPSTFIPSETVGGGRVAYYGTLVNRAFLSALGESGSGSLSTTNPTRKFAISGLEFAMPALAGNLDGTFSGGPSGSTLNYTAVDRAYTMVWFNTYVDPTADNLAKFIVVQDDGTLGPADQSGQLPIQAFGLPAYHHRGGMNEFATNLGTAGVMTTLGTLTDFVPPPGSPSALGPGV